MAASEPTTAPSSATSARPSAPRPQLQFAVRGRDGVKVYNMTGPSDIAPWKTASATARGMQYSADGSLLALIEPENVVIYNTATADVVQTIPRGNVSAIAFSPLGTYLVTWERLVEQNKDANLFVWNVKTGEELVHFVQKVYMQEQWPTVKWTEDEMVAARMVTNGIHFYTNGNFQRHSSKCDIEHISKFSIAPGPRPYTIAAFVPEKKGAPGFVRLYRYPELDRPIAQKSFYKAQDVDLLWNRTGSSLLVATHTDVDRSGKSYYGETGLYLMRSDGNADINVTLSKEGPIHETTWTPDGSDFMVIYGFMPAKATLFDGTECSPKADFGSAPRNTARFAPHGRVVVIGGFGNLQGQMDFWDYKKLKKLGTATAHCAAHIEWSPSSEFLLTAVLSPRIRVDNGFRIWTNNGEPVYEEPANELYQVTWRPAPYGALPRPRSPRGSRAMAAEAAGAKTATAAQAGLRSSPTGTYRHPNFRGGASGTSLLRDVDDKPKKYTTPAKTAKLAPLLPVGADPAEAVAKKKRKKKKKPAGEATLATTAGSGDEEKAETEENGDVAQTGGGAIGGTDVQRKVKALQKKLRQIQQLKEKQAKGETLDEQQQKKVLLEESLLKELAVLQKATTE